MSRKKPDQSVYRNFALRISSKIKNKYDFARVIGVAYETVRSWCKGESLPDCQQLALISKNTDISIDWLLTGEEVKSGFGCAFPDDVKRACETVAEIMMSGNPAVSGALLANIDVFRFTIQQEKEIQEIKKELRKRDWPGDLDVPENPGKSIAKKGG